jgi:di/tricarboxylate transporter
MALTLCLIAIVVSIFVGWKFKLNTGIIAMAFAFIIGIGVMGMKASAIIAFWPTNIVFWLLAIALFFNYPTENGTMSVLGQKLLYAMGGNAKLIPFAIAAVSAIVGFLGAGASTPGIVGPFAYVMAATAGVNPVLTGLCMSFGNLVGSNNPYNGYGGGISKNLIIDNGVEETLAMDWSLKIWANCIIVTIVIIVVFYFLLKGHKGTHVKLTGEPPKFNPVQKKTFVVVMCAFALMIIPPVLNTWITGVPFLKTLNQLCQPQVIMMLGALVCAILKLGDEKTIIRKIPASTIVMIVGVYSLIQVAAEAGLVDAVSNALQNSLPRALVPTAVIIFAAFLSFFSSSTSTVMPLMYPMVPALAESFGFNPIMLYTCVFFGGLATSCSPFSTGGAITIAGNPYEDQKEAMPNKMIVAAIICPIITVIVCAVGLFNLFPA